MTATHNTPAIPAAAALIAAAALTAWITPQTNADVRQRSDFADIGSFGELGEPENTIVDVDVAGGYELGFIDVIGTWTDPFDIESFGSEARIAITAPGATEPVLFQLGSGLRVGDVDGESRVFKISPFAFAGADPAGTWSFEFYESFDDRPAGNVIADMVWSNLQIRFTDEPMPTTLRDLESDVITGPASAFNGLVTFDGNNASGNPAGSRSYLDGPNGFDPGTIGSGDWNSPENVYRLDWRGGDLDAILEILNDDANLDLFLYGDDLASEAPLGSSTSSGSEDEAIFIRDLPEGEYWLVIDGINCDKGDYRLSINAIPAAGTGATLLFAGLFAGGRRSRRDPVASTPRTTTTQAHTQTTIEVDADTLDVDHPKSRSSRFAALAGAALLITGMLTFVGRASAGHAGDGANPELTVDTIRLSPMAGGRFPADVPRDVDGGIVDPTDPVTGELVGFYGPITWDTYRNKIPNGFRFFLAGDVLGDIEAEAEDIITACWHINVEVTGGVVSWDINVQAFVPGAGGFFEDRNGDIEEPGEILADEISHTFTGDSTDTGGYFIDAQFRWANGTADDTLLVEVDFIRMTLNHENCVIPAPGVASLAAFPLLLISIHRSRR